MVKELRDAKLLRQDSPIKNLRLVLIQMMGLGDAWNSIIGEPDETTWMYLVAAAAKKCGDFKIRDKEDDFPDMEENEEGESYPPGTKWESVLDKAATWKAWSHDPMYREYSKHHCPGGKPGGHQFDITKMSSGERTQYAFDKKDPLQDPRYKAAIPPKGAKVCTR